MTATDTAERNKSYLLCTPSMPKRLLELIDTIRDFDRNSQQFNHNVPIIIYLDAPVDTLDSEGKLKSPYKENFDKLIEAVQERDERGEYIIKSDVFFVMPEDQKTYREQLKPALRSLRPQHSDFIDSDIDSMLGSSCGGIKNLIQISTRPPARTDGVEDECHIIIVDDDMRFLELATRDSSIVGMEQGNNRSVVMSGNEVGIEGNLFDALATFDPRKDRLGYHSNSINVSASDVLSAVFAISGLRQSEVERQLRDVIKADYVRYTDTLPYPQLNVENSNYPSQVTAISELQHAAAAIAGLDNITRDRKIHEAHAGVPLGVKPYPVSMVTEGSLIPKTQDPMVEVVMPLLSAAADWDAYRHMQLLVEDSSIAEEHLINHALILSSGRNFRMCYPVLAETRPTLNCGIMGISGNNTTPFSHDNRKEEAGPRTEVKGLIAHLNTAMAHLRSPTRDSIGIACYQEEVGTQLHAMLLNAGHFGYQFNLTEETTRNIWANAKSWHEKLEKAIEVCKIEDTDQDDVRRHKISRGIMLMQVADEFQSHFAGFNPKRFQEFHEKFRTDLKREWDLYIGMRTLWLSIQEVARRPEQSIILTDSKKIGISDAKITMAQVQADTAYDRVFTYKYGPNHNIPLTNAYSAGTARKERTRQYSTLPINSSRLFNELLACYPNTSAFMDDTGLTIDQIATLQQGVPPSQVMASYLSYFHFQNIQNVKAMPMWSRVAFHTSRNDPDAERVDFTYGQYDRLRMEKMQNLAKNPDQRQAVAGMVRLAYMLAGIERAHVIQSAIPNHGQYTRAVMYPQFTELEKYRALCDFSKPEYDIIKSAVRNVMLTDRVKIPAEWIFPLCGHDIRNRVVANLCAGIPEKEWDDTRKENNLLRRIILDGYISNDADYHYTDIPNPWPSVLRRLIASTGSRGSISRIHQIYNSQAVETAEQLKNASHHYFTVAEWNFLDNPTVSNPVFQEILNKVTRPTRVQQLLLHEIYGFEVQPGMSPSLSARKDTLEAALSLSFGEENVEFQRALYREFGQDIVAPPQPIQEPAHFSSKPSSPQEKAEQQAWTDAFLLRALMSAGLSGGLDVTSSKLQSPSLSRGTDKTGRDKRKK